MGNRSPGWWESGSWVHDPEPVVEEPEALFVNVEKGVHKLTLSAGEDVVDGIVAALKPEHTHVHIISASGTLREVHLSNPSSVQHLQNEGIAIMNLNGYIRVRDGVKQDAQLTALVAPSATAHVVGKVSGAMIVDDIVKMQLIWVMRFSPNLAGCPARRLSI